MFLGRHRLPTLLGSLFLWGACVMYSAKSDQPILKGYTQPVAGEQMGYHCFHPYATSALITRCTDGKRIIKWQTESLPSDRDGGFVTFGWIAGHSAGTSTGDRVFRFAINGEEWFSIATSKDRPVRRWVLQGKHGSTLSFETKWEDSVHDLFGYLFLRVPVRDFPPLKPLALSIVGDSAQSADWFMTYTYAMEESVKSIAQPALIRTPGGERQLVEVLIDHVAADGKAEIASPGEPPIKAAIQMGFNRIPYAVLPVKSTKRISLDVDVSGNPKSRTNLVLEPVTHREFWLLPHSHNDIGYSDLQADVKMKQLKNLREAIRLVKKTAGYPAEARFKWNTEILWAVDHFLASCTADEREEFIRAVKDGGIGLDGLYSNQLTGLCRPEELIHLTDFAQKLRQDYGVKVNDAMITDIPGYTWAVVPSLALSGIKYFSSGPNYIPTMTDQGDRVGHFNKAWADRPFYWVSPSGQEKILFWVAGKGYSWFHDWIAGKAGPRTASNLFDYARELDRKQYPYDMVQLRYTIVADNGPVDPDLPDFVKDWNERYVSPRLIIATTGAMFEEFERRWGTTLPAFAGDISPFWEDGALSTLHELGIVRRSSERLVQAEAVRCIYGRTATKADLAGEAWRNIHLFDEHTWGAHNSISEPESPFAVSQWEVKRAYAVDADKQSKEVLSAAMASSAGGSTIEVINTSSWPRSDLVILSKEQSTGGDRVSDEQGRVVPSQRLSTGELAFVARGVPPLGASSYSLDQKSPLTAGSVTAGAVRLGNSRLSVELDPRTGALRSLKTATGVEYVDTTSLPGLNQYLYVRGRSPDAAQRNVAVKVEVTEAGPIVGTLRITSNAPGCNSLIQEIRVVEGISRVELMNTIDKQRVNEKESIHMAFPFRVPDGKFRLDGGWGIVRPTADQLPGSCMDYLPAGRWVDVSNQDYGICWTTLESPLIEIGAMTDESRNAQGDRVWRNAIVPGTLLFSYAMNNYWHTNYKAYQEGPSTLHYALFPHGMFVGGEAYRRGIEQSQPLLVRVSPAGYSAPRSLFTIESSSIVATAVDALEGGKGLLIRLFNAGGKPDTTEIKWGKFKPTRTFMSSSSGGVVDPAAISLPAYGIVTLRCEY